MKAKWLCLSAAMFFVRCGDDRVACLTYATAGLSVSVTNAAAGQPLCDAVVTATEGGYSERLYENACTFSGAYERPGTYVLRVTRQGFHPNELAAVHVVMGGGECPHVQPTRVTILLTPID